MKLNCNVVYTTLKAQISNYWYFENEYSYHITRDKSFFANLVRVNDAFVVSCDGNKAMICEKGCISAPGLPELRVKLISISQIYNNKCLVKFTHKKFTMYDNSLNVMVKGTMS